MAAAFNLTAQINLQGPNNLKPIVSKIKKDLGSIKTTLNLDVKPGIAKNIGQISRSLNTLSKAAINANANISTLNGSLSALASSFNNASSTTSAAVNSLNTTSKAVKSTTTNVNQARSAIEEFGKQSGLAIKRFAAFSTVSTVIYGFVNALTSAFKEFVVFNQEIVRLSQVTNKSVTDLSSITKEITRLSTGLGVASGDLLKVTTTLAQAGFTAEETKTALEALAKSALAPSFENIADTTEGAIAAMRQFGIQAGELDAALGSINAVAAAFAVEAGDIITAIQRTGGVFAASSKGVSEGTDALNEFIAVFTSIRATTRESAETIATGLRTIFTRIQRSSTIQLLKDYGVELRDLEGKFVGPYEAVRRLSEGLNRIDPRSAAFATISEELGGFRQIGKVIPLIQQFATAQDALKVAQRGQGSLATDAITAQQALAIQFNKTRESFLALIRDIGNTNTFKAFTSGVFLLTNGLISLVGALKPVLPLLLTFAAIKIGGAVREYSSGFLMGLGGGGRGGPSAGPSGPAGTPTPGGGGSSGGGAAGRAAALLSNTSALTTLNQSVLALNQNIVNTNSLLLNRPTRGFATGGLVPGVGNSDSVSARLTPGEFVIRKKAVEAIGADNLASMNRYASGGQVNITAKELKNRYRSSQRLKDLITDDAMSELYRSGKAINTEDNISFSRRAYKLNEPDLINDHIGFEEAVAKKTNGIRTNIGKSDPNFPIDITNSNYGPLEVRNRSSSTSNRTLLDKLIRYYISTNQYNRLSNQPTADSIPLGKLGIVYNSAKYNPPNAQELNIGGIVQKFAGGGQALGARPTIKELDDTELAQLSTSQLIKYAKDLAYDIFTTGGAGMAIGSEFIEVPKEKIIPELESSLVSYMGKRGFWREKVARFGKPIEQKSISASKLGREAALESQVSRYADEVAARSQEWASIRSGSSIDNYLMKSLQDPILSDYKSAREGKPLAKAFHQTRLRKAVNEALDSFDDFDYSGANIDKLVSGMAAKRFASGGSVEDTVPALLTPGEFVINKKAAQRIGYGKLNKLNHADKIQGFNKGGAVGIQRFAQGGNALSLDKAAVVAAITSILLPEVQRLAVSFAKLEGTAANFGAALGGAVREASSLVLSAGFSLQAVGAKKGQVAAAQVGGFIGGAVGGALTDGTAKAMEKALLKNTEFLGKFSKNLEDLRNAPTEELRLEASKRLEESFYILDSSVRASIPGIENMEKLNNLGQSIGTLTTTVLTITTAMIALRAATNSMARSAALAAIAARQAGNASAASSAMGSLGLARGLGRAIPYVGLVLTAASAAYEAYSLLNTSIKSTGDQLNKLSEALEETVKNAKEFNLSTLTYSEGTIPNFRNEVNRLTSQGLGENQIRLRLGRIDTGNEFNLLLRKRLQSALAPQGIDLPAGKSIAEVRKSLTDPAEIKTFQDTIAEVSSSLRKEFFIRAKIQEGATPDEAAQLLKTFGETSSVVRVTAEEYIGSIIKTKLSSDELAKANNNLKISLASLNNVLSLTESSFQKILTRTTNQFNDLDRTIAITSGRDPSAAFTGGEFIRRDIQVLDNLSTALPEELDAVFQRLEGSLGIPTNIMGPLSQNDTEQRKLFDQLVGQTKGLSIIERSIGPVLTKLSSDRSLTDENVETTIDTLIGQSLRAALGTSPEGVETTNKLVQEIKSAVAGARAKGDPIKSLEDLGPVVSGLLEGTRSGVDLVKKSLESLGKTSDLLSEQQKKLIEEEEKLRQVQIQRRQTDLKRSIELQKSLGKDVSLQQLNELFTAEIKDLTAGLRIPEIPDIGTIDVETINAGLEASKRRLQETIDLEKSNPELKGTFESNKKREIIAVDRLQKAMIALSDRSIEASNTLEEIAKQRDLFKSRREVLIDFIKGSFNPAKALEQRAAVESIALARSGQPMNPEQFMTFFEGGGRQLLEATAAPGVADEVINNALKQFGLSLPSTPARDYGVEFIDKLGFAIPKLQQILDNLGATENRAQEILDKPTIDSINNRAKTMADIFFEGNNSFKKSFGGIVQFFDDLAKRFSGQFGIPQRTNVALSPEYIQEVEKFIKSLAEQRVTTRELIGRGGAGKTVKTTATAGVALSQEQAGEFLRRLTTGDKTPTEIKQLMNDINQQTLANERTALSFMGMFSGFDPLAGQRGRESKRFIESGPPGKGFVGGVFQRAQELQTLSNEVYKIFLEQYNNAVKRGTAEPLNQNFPPANNTPLSINTTQFDNTVNNLVNAFTSDNNNITQLAASVASLGKVTDGLKYAVEELRRTIPDGKIAMNIEQKSNITVDIPDPVEVRSTSMRLDNRDSEALAIAIGNGIKDSIGSVFKFAGLG